MPALVRELSVCGSEPRARPRWRCLPGTSRYATAKHLYAEYIAPGFDSQAQTWSVPNCYVRKITIGPCLADMNLNSIADPGDFDVFVDAYLAEDMQADLNENMVIDEDDYESFVESYDALENM